MTGSGHTFVVHLSADAAKEWSAEAAADFSCELENASLPAATSFQACVAQLNCCSSRLRIAGCAEVRCTYTVSVTGQCLFCADPMPCQAVHAMLCCAVLCCSW
jgi:hypothetical protein